MKPILNPSNQQSFTDSKPLSKMDIPESTRESLMSMMREIMEKSYLHSDELHYIAEESVEESVVERDNDAGERDGATRQFTKFPFGQNHSLKQVGPLLTGPKAISDSVPQQLVLVPSSSSELSKLLQITERCMSYYSTFSLQKSSQLQIIQKTFTDLNSNLNLAFQEMISELVKKKQELKEFFLKKYEEIVRFRENQDECLKRALNQIKQFYVVSQKSPQPSVQLHSYASTLNEFYSIMQDIQKSNFKQMVQESVNFINNLVTEQIRVTLYEKIPARLTQKRMMRQSSKDFLLESRDNSVEIRSDTFGILDVESFTKLFLDADERVDNVKEERKCLEKGELCLSGGRDSQNQDIIREKKKMLPLNQTILEESNRKQNPVASKPVASKFYSKKQNQTLITPVKKNVLSQQNNQNQTELQLIRKISHQQTNRSAKIKSYLVTFQESRPQHQQVAQAKKAETSRALNHSRSSSQVSRTPTKLNKSGEKKGMACSGQVSHSNEQRLKNSSLKTSRNVSAVSEFRLNSAHRQSLAASK